MTERRLGQEQARHHQARHRARPTPTRRCASACGCRTCSTPRSSAQKLDLVLKEKNAVLAKVYNQLPARRSTRSPTRYLGELAPRVERRTSPTPSTSCTRRSRPASTCCSRARRPPSSTSTTAPIPSSRRRTRWPAAPAPAPGVGPRYIDRVIGIAKAYVHPGRRRAVPDRAVRRRRRPARRAGPRVRHQHRPPPAHRLVRRGDAAPRRAAQLAVRGRHHQARRARRARHGEGLRRPTRSTASASTACPYHQSRAARRDARSTRSCPAGRPT